MTAAVEERVNLSEPKADDPKGETALPDQANRKLPPPKDEYASFDDLISKKPRERDVTIVAGDSQLKLHLRAIGTDSYDQLVASCPPSSKDQDRGLVFDQKAFQPKLVAAVVARPRMDLDRASRLMADPNWSGGEWGGLYQACVEICQVGIDVPFNGGG